MLGTLYENLKEAESLPDELASELTETLQSLGRFAGKSGFTMPSIDTGSIDVEAEQRKVFAKYRANRVLIMATRGVPVEETLVEVSTVNDGLRRVLPRRKDENHNRIVTDLGQLVGYTRHYQCNGLLALDNVISGSMLMTALGVLVTSGFAALRYFGNPNIGPNDMSQLIYDASITLQYSLCLSAIMGPIAGGSIGSQRREGPYPITEARYIDNKIEELKIRF